MPNTSPIPLLINFKAGSLYRSGLRSWLRCNIQHFQLMETACVDELRDRARSLAEAGAPVVAVAGGDGTLMNAAAGLLGTRTALGILPSGTMNVFARELGIGSRRFDLALAAMQGEHRQEVDVFCINERPFLQMASFGLDARIVQLITPSLKRRMGAMAHVVTALQVMKERVPLFVLSLPNGEELSGSELILGNGKRYGGEARLFANACLNDGLLDVAVFNQGSIPILIEIISNMLQQGATDRNTSDVTSLRRLHRATITARTELPYQLDGDFAGVLRVGESATVTCSPERLLVCVPRCPVFGSPLERMLAHPKVTALIARLKKVGTF